MLRRITVAATRLWTTATPSCSSGRTITAKAEEDLTTKRARLLYQSKKRGILENDILLGEFAEQNLKTMDDKQLREYDTMINGDHMEWDLFYYLSGKKPAPPEVQNTSAYELLKKFVDAKKAGSK